MAFSHPGRADKERAALLADKVTGGQLEMRARSMEGLKAKSKLSRERSSRKSAACGAGDRALLSHSHVDFVLENDFQELGVWSCWGCISKRRVLSV